MGNLTENFDSHEFASMHDGITTQVPLSHWVNLQELAFNLQTLRDRLGQPIVIHSGYRTLKHNTDVGGVANSRHLIARAADFSIAGINKATIYCTIEELIQLGEMKQGGLGIYSTHLHYDTRGIESRWAKDISAPICPELEEEEDMANLVLLTGSGAPYTFYLSTWMSKRILSSMDELSWYRALGVAEAKIPQVRLNEIPLE